jgi:hypothetical protein
MKKKMSPRGCIEFFEERAFLLTLTQRTLPRDEKWKLFYRNDYNEFQVKMKAAFPTLSTMIQAQQESFVSELVTECYANTSCFHRSFDMREVCCNIIL